MPKINCSEMPSIEIKRFCMTFCEAIISSTEDKSFREKFERHISSKEVDSLAQKENVVGGTANSSDSYTVCHS